MPDTGGLEQLTEYATAILRAVSAPRKAPAPRLWAYEARNSVLTPRQRTGRNASRFEHGGQRGAGGLQIAGSFNGLDVQGREVALGFAALAHQAAENLVLLVGAPTPIISRSSPPPRSGGVMRGRWFPACR
jgi:hypothetical protein